MFLSCQKDRDATRCELERLLTTAGTDDKKKKVILALDHLEVIHRRSIVYHPRFLLGVGLTLFLRSVASRKEGTQAFQ